MRCNTTRTLLKGRSFMNVAFADYRLRLSGILSPDTEEIQNEESSIARVAQMESPRLIKTHLSLSMLPDDIMAKKVKVRESTKITKVFFLNYAVYH